MCDIPDHMFLWDIASLKQNEFECDYDFSIAVYKLYFITLHTSLIPGAPFSTGKQQEGLRAVSHTSLTPGAPFSTGKQQEGLRAVETSLL